MSTKAWCRTDTTGGAIGWTAYARDRLSNLTLRPSSGWCGSLCRSIVTTSGTGHVHRVDQAVLRDHEQRLTARVQEDHHVVLRCHRRDGESCLLDPFLGAVVAAAALPANPHHRAVLL